MRANVRTGLLQTQIQKSKTMVKKTIPLMGLNIAHAERPFVEAMKLYQNGDTLVEASDDLKAVVQAVRENGGKGELTVKISVAGQGKAVAIKIEVNAKKPKNAKPASKLFADENGRLGQYDPDQYQMAEVMDEAASKAPYPAEL